MHPATLLALLVAFAATAAQAKLATCRTRFNKDSWLYCSKFGAPANSNLQVDFRAKLIAYG